ncbi:MAG: alpha-amylase family glycosyl hydrolase [Bacteroidales bacterium]|nr:alpha-amylase family glycosyl hydrolase [Bacteroidales bacterium]MDD2323387.1 alpha-amylase family glycosyl hydrolase [Bacteroidales bacterium]MDD3010806.1 alpha-amylase family glycosyl hydrolase [Bacteroidales bacterium]MDD3961749.1 alpha-amylase family glycosyl hydrolase [Bacteroidales bacterium]MDY0285119.1 alpha-amylase family glycosyl hydrolase [Bacteroidales bacterium]
MNQERVKNRLSQLWISLYGNLKHEILHQFIDDLVLHEQFNESTANEEGWYKDAIVYSLYVDLFNDTFKGLTQKLDYLEGLGVNCLWLLPVLDSPMRDAGFDIRDYRSVRKSLLDLPTNASEEEAERLFLQFLDAAHARNIKVIFDIAMNHVSEEHHWFQEARKGKDNPYYDYFIWSDNDRGYPEARLLFKGMCPSNWEKAGNQYFFHRFFEFQPDLNYRNPRVLIEMCQNLLYWVSQNVDGFRADAIPYLWKEEGTTCENLPQTHTIVQFFKTVLDFVRPNTLLLAEACQKPKEVVKYIGDGKECNAGYHFPLMPMIYKALALHTRQPIINTLNPAVTPSIAPESQWFTFLRCHDELSLERIYVTEEDRKLIHKQYCHTPQWDFRMGEGISARLSELMEHNADKIALAFSVMLSLPGTPILYYGDEFAKKNDEAYYQQQIQFTGKNDTRFLVRGKIDWDHVATLLSNPESTGYKVFTKLSAMIAVRKQFKAFGRGTLEWLEMRDEKEKPVDKVLSYARCFNEEKIIVLQNLSPDPVFIKAAILKNCAGKKDHLGKICPDRNKKNGIILSPWAYYWV